jgi:hypothetical protein
MEASAARSRFIDAFAGELWRYAMQMLLLKSVI